ncbi:hypothetical protein [Desulfuromonas sp. TF]|uniref:hypothetical protein n=1 Tax=Desulfuromonas sp. TF TaxID=1232410 RepID=UPI000414A874|nr:hypothetical protein [Desulfuromonas sp. TF]
MFVFDVPGGELLGVDTEAGVAVLEEVMVDTSAGVTGPDLVLVDTLAEVAVLEEILVDTLAEVAVLEEILVDTSAAISALELVLVDTLAGISGIDRILVDSRVLLNPSLFIHAAGAVYFSVHPSRPYEREILRRQVRGFDSSGAPRVYKKGNRDRILWSLFFPRLEVLDFEDLLVFMRETVKGTRGAFTWRDHEGAERLVKFREPRLQARPNGVGRVSVSFDLVEGV